MIRKTLSTAILTIALAAPAFAAGKVELTDANTDKIRAMLTEDGYTVGKIKLEDGMYEAYAKKDGHKYEVFLDGDFAVVKVEEDD